MAGSDDSTPSSSKRRTNLPIRLASDAGAVSGAAPNTQNAETTSVSARKNDRINPDNPRNVSRDKSESSAKLSLPSSTVDSARKQPARTNRGRDQPESSMPGAKDRIGALQNDPDFRARLGNAAAEPTSQQQLNEYRERLARDLELRELSSRGLGGHYTDKVRVSPIPEENATTFSSPFTSSTLTSTSTDSGNTVRGGTTPAAMAATPSYPFPRMAPANSANSSNLQRPYHLPPMMGPHSLQSPDFSGAQDRVLSGESTPASILTFHPPGVSPQPENFDFPTPNLYDLSLMLAAEPGLDAWWTTVVQIMKDVYRAERVTLAVPADTTDIENVPWGQKATYNEHQEDELSLGYMGKESSAGEAEGSDWASRKDEASNPGTPSRPGIMSRHSFTSYEENKEKAKERSSSALRRPVPLPRSQSYLATTSKSRDEAVDHRHLNKDALDEHDAEGSHYDIPSWEAPLQTDQPKHGRVLPVLQALNYEADPLIEHTGVMRVLERGRTVALTRSYPYLHTRSASEQSGGSKSGTKSGIADSSKKAKDQRRESFSKLSSIIPSTPGTRTLARGKGIPGDKGHPASTARFEIDAPRPTTPKYEEYEQAPPSPWSQSPAPSPAVRSDTKENPFFTDATVDEESFNPGSDHTDYANMRAPEAIGVDNSWTVLHIPLAHVLLSKPVQPFKLDASAMEQKSQSRSRDDTGSQDHAERVNPESSRRTKALPIAILSILSPVIPYPSNLRHSLEHLAPHLATSFSLCRHYSHLETELAGLQRRRPRTAGFGAVDTSGRPLGGTPYLTTEDIARQQSRPGSITSPSDYSTVSKSATGSPSGTPGWDQGSLSSILERRQPAASPAGLPGTEGYFSSKQRPSSSRQDASISATQRPRPAPKDTSPGDKRQSRLASSKPLSDVADRNDPMDEGFAHETGRSAAVASGSVPPSIKDPETGDSTIELGDEAVADRTVDRAAEALRQRDHAQSRHSHSMLHSYGADFASTFQSLPPSSSLVSRPSAAVPAPSRSGSLASAALDMPPPSDRLKGLILDSLPAHVFVALPQTGEIVWVNSRYLSYRGQAVADLAADPWGSIHPEDRDEYLRAWGHSLRTGEQFSRTVRIKRFDGAYRWFYARAVASKDKRGVIMQFLGSYMDIHDQHIAELKAARQEEIEASEAKHRLLANLIPQIIFTATEEDGITFANEQWLSYTGQSFDDALGLGFMDFVHPDDLAKCRIATDQPPTPLGKKRDRSSRKDDKSYAADSDTNIRGIHQAFSRHNSSSSSSVYELPAADLTELARKGIVKVGKDSIGRPSYTTEVRLRSKSGEYRWHLIRCVEIDTIDFGSGASSYFGSATDINDHKLLEAKLKEAMESKGRFLSNMSHEIRTPLIGISGMVSFLQDTILNEEQRDYTNTIQTSANSLIMIINDILDLSKVDAGMMKLKFEWFHTRSLIEDVNELVSTMAIAKRLELNYLVEADVPAWVKGDKVRVRQVLLNVIGNAIKFTSEGEVFSRCRVYSDDRSHVDANQIMLEFAITDTGRGFSKEEADLIFKPFSQIDGSSTRQHGGSGLGLVISRQLVELHGGKMEGKAVLGEGSTFTFTATFSLPTADDHPNLPGSPVSTMSATSRQESSESVPGNLKPLLPPKQLRNLEEPNASTAEADTASPAVTSTGSSNQSVHSGRSQVTDRTSVSSVNAGLARFSEAAKASGQDLSQMKLEMPSGRSSPGRTATPGNSDQRSPDDFRPPMYSILIISPQLHSREATVQHIEMTLPKDVPHQITPLATVEEAGALIGGEDAIKFTHIVINLVSAEAIIDLMEQINNSQKIDKTTILILSDSVQRQAVIRLTAKTKHERLLADNLVTFIYKPVKPSRFAVIFDPDKMRELSVDRNRSSAQQMVENQKASYLEIEKLVGNKGHKVLLVEDNPVNQKVLTKYLNKIGVDVEVAMDGVECTDMVLSKPHKYYSLILCDLHMPRKDGYQACREIRQWENMAHFPKKPIIALSANVMSDVPDKCAAAGFSDYVTKPVDFIDLSRAMAKFF